MTEFFLIHDTAIEAKYCLFSQHHVGGVFFVVDKEQDCLWSGEFSFEGLTEGEEDPLEFRAAVPHSEGYYPLGTLL